MQPPLYSAADWGEGLLRLMPTGLAWSRETDAVNAQVIRSLGGSYARLNARANYLLVDAFPATTAELLPEWEATLGLPDPCAGPDQSEPERVMHVVARLTQQNGPSIPGLTAYAATLGYDITIQEFAPSRFGQDFGMDFGGDDWAHAWQISAPGFSIDQFTFGANDFGDPFATWGNTVLFCEMQRLKPAHTILLFSYGGSPAFLLSSLLTDAAGNLLTDAEGNDLFGAPL